MNKNVRHVVWFIIVLSGCIFTMTIFLTLQGVALIGWFVIAFLLLLQIIGLVYYLHRKSDAISLILKVFLILLHLSSLGVIASFAFSVFSLSNEYHNPIKISKTSENTNITVKETDNLYIFYPEYTSIELMTGNQPSRNDQSINFCCAASFQDSYELSYSPSNINGIFVINGEKYDNQQLGGFGVFSFYNGQYHFANEDEAQAEIENTVKNKGYAFSQFMIIDDCQIILIPSNEYRCMRVLAELDNKLCVIDSKVPVHYEDFAEELVSIGVQHAFYMDMGSGWNYSWYRDNHGSTNTLIGMYWPFSHNWLVFKS